MLTDKFRREAFLGNDVRQGREDAVHVARAALTGTRIAA